jgi:hypothetical protein
LAAAAEAVKDITRFEAIMLREDRPKGFFESFDFTADARTEIGR